MFKPLRAPLSLPLAGLLCLAAACGDTPPGDDDASNPTSPTPTDAPAFPPDLELDVTSLSFGEVGVGAEGSETLTVSNVGEGALQIDAIAPELQANASIFTVDPAGPYDPIPQGGSIVLTIGFEPDDAVAYADDLVITSNDPESPHRVALDGTGIPGSIDADEDTYDSSVDCDDDDPAIHPGAVETPYDGVDQDCDGADLDDVDLDGYVAEAAGGDDCDDADGAVHPNATDTPYDGIDQDCTGDDEADIDNDGYMAEAVGGDDCDDENANTYPGAAEYYDGEDNDCDGAIDDDTDANDDDGDGYSEQTGDCNDGNDTVYPGAIETPYDNIDQDCSGVDLSDVDQDGYVASQAGGNDCDDDDAAIYPDAAESCNTVDDDCDGQIDEGVQTTWYVDADADSYGNPASPVQACELPSGSVANADDCNDSLATAYPGAAEVCDDADNDCNGSTDEGVTSTFYADADGDSFGDELETTQACAPPAGYVADDTDCDDGAATTYPGAAELCNGLDDSCDGAVDEGAELTFYRDADSDGYGNAAVTATGCSAPEGYAANATDCDDGNAAVNPGQAEVPYNGIDDDCAGGDQVDVDQDGYPAIQAGGNDCDDNNSNVHPGASEIDDDLDNDCDGTVDEGLDSTDDDGDGYSEQTGDCDDAQPKKYPGANEVCDTLDNDCDGTIDEGVKSTFYRDADGDGYGAASLTTQACTAPAGYVADNTDCDDNNGAVHPNATEACNSKDDDCDGSVDEGVKSIYYRDTDGDGYGVSSLVIEACSAPSGYSSVAGDCDDTKASVNPGATETCNAVDDDCDGSIDEGVATVYYRDGDTDGYGSSVSTTACSAPPGYVTQSGDCDDTKANVNPGAAETCDTLDNNCNGSIDEGVTKTYYKDADKDGYGTVLDTVQSCTLPGGYSATSGDCNDSASTIYPGAPEKCNGLDDDCDGAVDEGAQNTYYQDADGDTYGNPKITAKGCSAPTGYVLNSTDCDDTNASINPGAQEVCDGVDNNCNGDVDGADAVDGTAWYYDGDGDGYGAGSVTVTSCEQPEGFVDNSVDCDDNFLWGIEEVCDGADNDCDGDPDFTGGYPTTRVGYYPYHILAGDWNDDGHLDLVTANYYSGSISVLFYTGGGSYSLRQTVSTGSGPLWVVQGDWDKDGDVDLGVSNYAGATYALLKNNGKGTFTVGSQLSLGFNPWGATADDWDKDGDVDLAIASYSGGTVAVFKNNGSGAFSIAGSPVLVGTNPISLVSGDWDKDSDADLAVANYGSGNLNVLKNNGSGTFTTSSTVSTGGSPYRVAVGDWNKDGNPDLAVSNYATHNLSLLKGSAAGVFSPSATVAVGYNPSGIAVGDLDKDGDQDLAVVNYSSHTVSVMRNNGTGSFNVIESPGTAYTPYEIAGGDLDEDGDFDFAVCAFSNGSTNGIVNVLRNNGSGSFQPPRVISAPTNPWGLTVADFNGDGLEDFAVSMYGSYTVTVYTQSSNGSFSIANVIPVYYYSEQLLTGDFDKDGDIDIAATTQYDYNRLYILLNDGKAAFSSSYVDTPGRTYGVAGGDWDKDGDFDLAVAVNYASGANSNLVALALNNGKGVFTMGSSIQVGQYPLGLVAGDFDKDGDLDLASGNYYSNSVSLLRNNGSGGFTQVNQYSVGTYPYNLVSADYDGDGYFDLATPNYGSSTVSVLMNDRLGGFKSAVSVSAGAQPLDMVNVDFDGDGDKDLAVSNLGQGTVTLILNGGSGVFTESAYVGTPGSAYALKSILIGPTGNQTLNLIVSNLHSSSITFLAQSCD